MKRIFFSLLVMMCSCILLNAAENQNSASLTLLSGTYINTQYESEGRPSKISIYVLESKYVVSTWYNKIVDASPVGQQVLILFQSWADNDGTIWFKTQSPIPDVTGFILSHLSADHNTLEQAGSDKNYPPDFNTSIGWHSLWHRQ
jgi:hypothetical protein